MNLADLNTSQIIAIAVVLLIVIGLVAYLLTRNRRSARLRAQFGPEYERAVAEGGDRRRAEAKLAERADRVQSYHLRPLSPSDRAHFIDEWTSVQAHFVDNPTGAVAEADQLLGGVMGMRGYPVADFEQRAADISVDHPTVVDNYRTAHEIALRHGRGEASTEDLRKAMIHYRALFDHLVAEPGAVDSRADARADAVTGNSSRSTSRGAAA
ncbi:MAG TPA: hypothetical protein VGG85_03725 [Terracidiphilus sp.]